MLLQKNRFDILEEDGEGRKKVTHDIDVSILAVGPVPASFGHKRTGHGITCERAEEH